MTSSIRDTVTWSFVDQGSGLSDLAKTKAGEEADALFREASEKYEQALSVKPHKNEALINWGTALFEEARTKAGEAADALFRQALEKYEAAVANKQDDYKTLSDWGSLLLVWSSKKEGGDQPDAGGSGKQAS